MSEKSDDHDIIMEDAMPPLSSSTSELHPIASLMDQLRSEDIEDRLEAMGRLPAIAVALGSDRARKELVPFLESILGDEDDEVLFVVCEQVPQLLDPLSVEGEPMGDVQLVLLPLLERLCSNEEVTVRSEAIKALQSIVQPMSAQWLVRHVWPVVRRLCLNEWLSSRQSGALLLPTVIQQEGGVAIEEAHMLLLKLASDEEPSAIVRRAAIPSLHLATADVVPLLDSLMSHPQDSIRMTTVPVIWRIFHRSREDNASREASHVAELTRKAAMDASWRVRYMLASSFPEAIACLPTESVDPLAIYGALLTDVEGEVRAEAARKMPQVVQVLGEMPMLSAEAGRKLLDELYPLITDPSSSVRLAMANAIPFLAHHILDNAPSCRAEISPIVSSLVTRLLHDDTAEVRLAIIEHFDHLVPVIGLDALMQDALLPAIKELHSDPKWRIRLAIVQHFPLLAKFIANTSAKTYTMQSTLVPFLCNSLDDAVWAVRSVAAAVLSGLFECDPQGFIHIGLPIVESLSGAPVYLLRLTALAEWQEGGQEAVKATLPILIRLLTSDAVCNVRTAACRTTITILPLLTSVELKEQLKNAIDKCTSSDTNRIVDEETKRQARRAMELLAA